MANKYIPPYLQDLSPAERAKIIEAMQLVESAGARHGYVSGSGRTDWAVYWAREFINAMQSSPIDRQS